MNKLLFMANCVIKRGGKCEPFRAEKLKKSIEAVCKDIRIPAVRAKKIVTEVSSPVLQFAAKQKAIKTSVLRAKILAGLRKAEPAAVKAWLQYKK